MMKPAKFTFASAYCHFLIDIQCYALLDTSIQELPDMVCMLVSIVIENDNVIDDTVEFR